MRLGAPLFEKYDDPRSWIAALKRAGYRAAYCPVGLDADEATVAAYARAAAAADIVIAEVGVWNNPLSSDEQARAAALDKCKRSLALADAIGARCCVNVAGSRSETNWFGPDRLDLTDETFEMIVATVREIIDAVRPTRSTYTLEAMPWLYPDSADSYVRLLEAIDRPASAVHFDPANLISNPWRFYNNAAVIREFVEKLGPHIRSVHAKDMAFVGGGTVQFAEVRPGLGVLDYRTLLCELARLEADLPVMLEHLPSAEEYALATDYVRSVASEVGVSL